MQKKQTNDEKKEFKELQKKLDSLEKLAMQIDRLAISLGRPWRVIWSNFLGGIFRGLGFTVGATLLIYILLKILISISKLNLPYIKEWVNDAVAIVADTPALHKYTGKIEKNTDIKLHENKKETIKEK